jgi:hypothetical protein
VEYRYEVKNIMNIMLLQVLKKTGGYILENAPPGRGGGGNISGYNVGGKIGKCGR